MGKRGVPLTDDEKQRILELVDQGLSYTKIAQQTGRSPQTVSRLAKAAGHDVEHSNLARVERANETRAAIGAERRAAIAASAADKLEEVIGKAGDPSYEVVMFGRGDTRRSEVVAVPAGGSEWRDWASAARSFQQVFLDLVRYDERGDDDGADVDRWLSQVVGGGS